MRIKDWTLDDDNAAGGVTLDSDTITLDGRVPYWQGNEEAKPSAIFTNEAKPEASWSPENKPVISKGS